MTNEVNNPHDKFFKATFSKEEVAKDFLDTQLPKEISELLDTSTFELLKDSFIDDRLSEHLSDLLYKVPLKDKPAKTYVYVLMEHKSMEERLRIH